MTREQLKDLSELYHRLKNGGLHASDPEDLRLVEVLRQVLADEMMLNLFGKSKL